MLTERENFEEVVGRGNPERFANQYDALGLIMHPVLAHRGGPAHGEVDKLTSWGYTVSWPEEQPGAFPNHREDLIVMPDVTRWREVVHAPQASFPASEWEPFQAQAEAIDRSRQFVTAMEFPGVFELCHYLGEITRTLANFRKHPQDMHDLISYITEWELEVAEGICTYLKPEALFHHDDWGTNNSTFLAPDMFAEFFLEPYKAIYGYYHDHGVKYVVHHSDSYAATLVPYMIEMGVNVWQGVMTSNDIPALIDKYGDKITFMGGIDSTAVDRPGWTPELVREKVKEACDSCGPLSFIPCQSQGLNLSTFPGCYEAIHDAIEHYSVEYFKTFDRSKFKDFSQADADGGAGARDKIAVGDTASAPEAAPAPEPGPQADDAAAGEEDENLPEILSEISEAVQFGDEEDVVELVQQALDEGLEPSLILNRGLIDAMTVIGEQFSAGEVFVPEMLMAADAMGEGTEVLKPYLADAGAEPVGKAVIGTVKGDQHDIGKNLVRMMIESKGFDITDLGTDVSAETFVDFLKSHDDVKIVCLSSLLTTTLPEIGHTIEAIEEAGLRDSVKIMIGGAPVTQELADEVGADAYTEDAGEAAARAYELVTQDQAKAA